VSGSSPTKSEEAALMAAAQWFVILASGEASAGDQAHWRQWRAEDTAHEQAWSQIEAAGKLFTEMPRERRAAMIQVLLRRPRRAAAKRVLMPVVLCLCSWGAWEGYRASDWSADAVTLIGQQREMDLADGTHLLLDTDTAVDVDFEQKARLIHVRRGRVLVETGHRTQYLKQPFIVITAHGSITALGTHFSVAPTNTDTRVAVIAARVAVHPGRNSGDLIVDTGQSARFDTAGVLQSAPLDRNDTAWSHGVLVADAMRLADLLAALNRYRSDRLMCDAAVAELRISGSFPLHDTDQALLALTQTLPLAIDRSSPGSVQLRQK
jgi:transmembrane sensor